MSKLQRLRDNIAAIECALKGGNDTEVLAKYTGFGGLGFILNPIDRPWVKSEQMYVDDTVALHTLLRGASKDERDYERWMDSLRASTLTLVLLVSSCLMQFKAASSMPMSLSVWLSRKTCCLV